MDCETGASSTEGSAAQLDIKRTQLENQVADIQDSLSKADAAGKLIMDKMQQSVQVVVLEEIKGMLKELLASNGRMEKELAAIKEKLAKKDPERPSKITSDSRNEDAVAIASNNYYQVLSLQEQKKEETTKIKEPVWTKHQIQKVEKEQERRFLHGIKRSTPRREVRQMLKEGGVDTKKVLNMVWRGRVLELLMLKKGTPALAKLASRGIKVSSEMDWNDRCDFAFSVLKVNPKKLKEWVEQENEDFISSTRGSSRILARESAREATMKVNEYIARNSWTVVENKKRSRKGGSKSRGTVGVQTHKGQADHSWSC